MDFSHIAINNFVDIVFYSMIVVFGLIGLLRGLINEIFSSLNWIISFLISIFLAPLISKLLAPHFSNGLILDIGTRIGVFFVSFVILLFGFADFFRDLKKSFPSIVDKPLGFAYGAGKALFLFGFAYSLYSNLYDFITQNNAASQQTSSTLAETRNQANIGGDFQSSEILDQGQIDNNKSEFSAQFSGQSKFPKIFQEANSAPNIQYFGELFDPIFQPIYKILIDNYGNTIKETVVKSIENSLKKRLLPNKSDSSSNQQEGQNPQDGWKTLVEDSKAVEQPSKTDDQNGDLNKIFDAITNDQKKTDPNPSQDQQNQQGYNKNDIQKKDRVFDIINQISN